MKWANFIHVYQPPTQKAIWVRRVADECYRPVFAGLLEIPRARLTLNINGVLCELLERNDASDVLDSIRTLLQRGQIELTGSAKFHAFLPLLPESEIERQILLNEETLRRYFGDAWVKSGFFSPEMAYSPMVAKVAKKLGYRWIIIDELAQPVEHLDHTKGYQIEGLDDFGVFFRERNLSFIILSGEGVGSVPAIMRYLGPRLSTHEYAVTGMDGETFGHHRPGLEMLLFDLFRVPDIEYVTLGSLYEAASQRETIVPRPSTWASTKQDLAVDQPYVRWQNPENIIQKMQWELTSLAIATGAQNAVARPLLDQALHSDQYWWSSVRPWWSLEMIERGAYDLRQVIIVSTNDTAKVRIRADELYRDIIFTGFEWQRSGRVDELSRRANEDVQERLEVKEQLFITREDYEHMIEVLTGQMELSARSKEFHRAAMIQDRIKELHEEIGKL